MRSRSVAALVAAFVLVPAGQAAATGGGHGGADRQLTEYAAKTWASFEAMTDERSGLPADILNATAARSVQTSTTNIGAYMWSAVAPSASASSPSASSSAALEDARDARTDGALRAGRAASTTTGTTTARERSSPTGRRAASRTSTRSCPRSTTGGSRSGCGSSRTASPSCRERAGALYDAMDFGFYYRPDRNRILLHFAPDTRDVALLLRHRRQREPDRRLHRDRPRPAPAEGVLRPLAHVPGHL